MHDTDSITKDYMKDAATFADAFNFLLYNGEPVIQPGQLREMDTTMLALPFGEDGVTVPEQKSRDVLKFLTAKADDNAAYCILGIENQTDVHYAMPVRNMLYDSMQYSNQVEAARKSHKQAKNYGTHEEFLSGFHKDEYLLPVITLVIYFGADKWDAPRSIHKMMLVRDERILQYTPDYKINLIAPEELSDTELEKFQTELCELLKFIKYSKDKKRLEEVVAEDAAFKNISKRTADAINTITHSEMKFPEGKETVDICKAIQDIRKDAIAEGKAEGRAEGKAEGRAEGEAIGEARGEVKGLMKALANLIASGMEESQARKILGL